MKKKIHSDFERLKMVKIPLYPFEICFTILSKQGKEYLIKEHGARARVQLGKKDGTAMSTIYFYVPGKTPEGVIAHEAYHVVEILMQEIGQCHSKAPNETWAYLVGWVVDEYYKFLYLNKKNGGAK